MFTTAVHSVRTKKDLLRIYNYLKNPQEILEQDKYNIDFYINVEKSRNSIKNYDIHDEKMEIDFKWDLSGYEELKGKEEWFMDTMVGNSLDRTPCAYHVYQAFSKGSVNVNEAYNIGIAFQEEMWPFTYTIIMITHSNKDNIHNHMLVIPDERSSFYEKSFYKRREEVTKMVWKKIKDNK